MIITKGSSKVGGEVVDTRSAYVDDILSTNGALRKATHEEMAKRIAELESRIATAGALASQKASHEMIIDALCGRLNCQT